MNNIIPYTMEEYNRCLKELGIFIDSIELEWHYSIYLATVSCDTSELEKASNSFKWNYQLRLEHRFN